MGWLAVAGKRHRQAIPLEAVAHFANEEMQERESMDLDAILLVNNLTRRGGYGSRDRPDQIASLDIRCL